jgi:hypothetical protein
MFSRGLCDVFAAHSTRMVNSGFPLRPSLMVSKWWLAQQLRRFAEHEQQWKILHATQIARFFGKFSAN